MSQNKAGGIKARDKIYKTYGVDHYRRIGALGGKVGTTGGFAYMKAHGDIDKIRKAGAKGGRISRKPNFMSYEFLDNNEPLFKPAKTLLDRIKIWDRR